MKDKIMLTEELALDCPSGSRDEFDSSLKDYTIEEILDEISISEPSNFFEGDIEDECRNCSIRNTSECSICLGFEVM